MPGIILGTDLLISLYFSSSLVIGYTATYCRWGLINLISLYRRSALGILLKHFLLGTVITFPSLCSFTNPPWINIVLNSNFPLNPLSLVEILDIFIMVPFFNLVSINLWTAPWSSPPTCCWSRRGF